MFLLITFSEEEEEEVGVLVLLLVLFVDGVDPNLHLVPCCYSLGHHHLSTPIPAECSRLNIIVHHLLLAGQSFNPCNGSPGHSGLIIG